MPQKISTKNINKKILEKGVSLQITKLDPDVYRRLKVYEAATDLEHAEVFEKAFTLLLAHEKFGELAK